MNMSKELLDMVDSDIKRIIDSENSGLEEKLELFRELDGRYQACIQGWYHGFWGWNPATNLLAYSLMRDMSSITENLHMAKAKLETYRLGINAIQRPEPPSTNVTVNTSVNISVTFEQVREQIEDMTSLTNEQTQEILDKINEIEKVVNSTDKKKTKWEKIKPVLIWLADKSCDVGTALLPLLLKI